MLKYYHPAVAKGKINWDSVLLAKIPRVVQAKDKAELSSLYLSWINELPPATIPAPAITTDTKQNTFLTWIDDDTYLSDTVQKLIKQVIDHRSLGPGHYAKSTRYTQQADFSNELKYDSLTNPSKEMRLLALFRFWNIVEYYCPGKYLIQEGWLNVLNEMIPKFYTGHNVPVYDLALRELLAHIHDSHGAFRPAPSPAMVRYHSAFDVRIIDDKAVIESILKPALAARDDIRIGDLITAVNDTLLSDYLADKKTYINASNDDGMLRNLAWYTPISWGLDSTIKMTFERGGISVTKIVHRDTEYFKFTKARPDTTTRYKMLDGNIGYVNFSALTPKDVKAMYKALSGTKAVIFDVRNYPKETMYDVCERFGDGRKPFAKCTCPNYDCPGTFVEKAPMECGPRKNKHPYQGKIVVLMNDITQSHAEFTCMSFKTLPNVTFIGSPTAGADGNVTKIFFPGGASTYISGLGIYYPDGKPTQRIGLLPDIECRPTIAGIQAGKDEVLERALSFIKDGK